MLKEHYCPFKVVCYVFIFHIESNDFSVSKFSSTVTGVIFTDIDGESSSDEVVVDSEIEEDVPKEEKEETS